MEEEYQLLPNKASEKLRTKGNHHEIATVENSDHPGKAVTLSGLKHRIHSNTDHVVICSNLTKIIIKIMGKKTRE